MAKVSKKAEKLAKKNKAKVEEPSKTQDTVATTVEAPKPDEKPAEVIEPEVISVKGYTKERKPKATYDDKYNSVRSICKHFFTDIVGLSIKFFCVSLRHMSIH